MTVKELKAFRAKLAYARKYCVIRDWPGYGHGELIVDAFYASGLHGSCADTVTFRVVPLDVFDWYSDESRTMEEREAMWDNSIAAIDAQIAKAKP